MNPAILKSMLTSMGLNVDDMVAKFENTLNFTMNTLNHFNTRFDAMEKTIQHQIETLQQLEYAVHALNRDYVPPTPIGDVIAEKLNGADHGKE